jgi:thioesterase domain-containing protein
MGREKNGASHSLRVIMSSSAEPGHVTTADVAAELAGDVNAAAEAYENLKRLLQRQLADPARASLQSGPNLQAAQRLTSLPSQASPMNLAFAARHARWHPACRESRCMPLAKSHAALISDGFLAGFAVSAALGAALYICLAQGSVRAPTPDEAVVLLSPET